MFRTVAYLTLGVAALALAIVAGCTNTPDNTPKAVQNPSPKNEPAPAGDQHPHKPGTHGGSIVEIGRDNYHAEVVVEKAGVIRVYVLGKDEAKVEEVESQTLTAYAKPEGGTEALEFALGAVPRPDDTKGKTSQFIGTLPNELWGKRVEVTVPAIRIADARFRFAFSSPESAHTDGVPPKVADEEERKLYLTPGGVYTAADVKANGSTTATEKFKGLTSNHETKPQAGDKSCPITTTKANAKFTWVVNGKAYEFCCPPCVDEFVKTAKEHPEQIKNPEDYLKR
jgi:YHS domain-containing protein